MLADQYLTNISIQLSASDFVSSSEKVIRQLVADLPDLLFAILYFCVFFRVII